MRALFCQQNKQTVTLVLCALCLASIVLLTFRQKGHSGVRIISQQLAWLPLRMMFGDASGFNVTSDDASDFDKVLPSSAKTTPSSESSGLFDPFNELAAMMPHSQKLATNNSGKSVPEFRIVYPKLYRALTKLATPPGNVAPKLLEAPPAKNLQQCRRPGDKNLAHLLAQPTSTFPFVKPAHRGGFWAPSHCWPPLSRTAILVPYRNRSENLDLFIPYMQALLQQQNIAFGIFVIEQANTKLFNRAKLLNVGFQVSQQFANFDCFILQDADKVPENVGNLYDCANSPKLMISEMRKQSDVLKYHRGRMYNNFLGGSAAISKAVFERVNGNSNRYYGWGREDDELASRLGVRGMRINYPGGHIARFINLQHSNDVVTNTMPWPYWHKVKAGMDKDGLNTLSYTEKGIYLHDLFVLIRADV